MERLYQVKHNHVLKVDLPNSIKTSDDWSLKVNNLKSDFFLYESLRCIALPSDTFFHCQVSTGLILIAMTDSKEIKLSLHDDKPPFRLMHEAKCPISCDSKVTLTLVHSDSKRGEVFFASS